MLILATTRSGPLLYAAGGLFAFVCFFAVLKMLYLAFHPDGGIAALTWPGLLLLVGALALGYSRLALDPARAFAQSTAEEVQAQCNKAGVCPSSISGWTARNDRWRSEILVGKWAKWPVRYAAVETQFDVSLMLAFDVAEEFSGGVGLPLQLPAQRPN
jgi:hypothetical protein